MRQFFVHLIYIGINLVRDKDHKYNVALVIEVVILLL
jgi:hypothetical protein